MATKNPPLKRELAEYNDRLDHCLRSRYGMTLRVFKAIKLTTQLVGAAGGIYAMSLGAPPLAALAMMTVIISGPEALEYFIENGD